MMKKALKIFCVYLFIITLLSSYITFAAETPFEILIDEPSVMNVTDILEEVTLRVSREAAADETEPIYIIAAIYDKNNFLQAVKLVQKSTTEITTKGVQIPINLEIPTKIEANGKLLVTVWSEQLEPKASKVVKLYSDERYTHNFIENEWNPTQHVVEIEAEDFVGEGFKVIEDAAASGGRCIVGEGDKNLHVSYELTLNGKADNFTIYGVHMAEREGENLSYIKINDFESYNLYDYELGKWNKTRIYYGAASAGKYTVSLSNVRKGQKIDKIIIAYDGGDQTDGGDAFVRNDYSLVNNFLPGNEAFKDLPIIEVPDEIGGYFFEAEEGNLSDKMAIDEDIDASGGKYWYAPLGNPKLDDPNSVDIIHMRFKFHVSRKGLYRLSIRYSTPVSNQKSTWFSVDDTNYQRIDIGNIEGWKWWTYANGYCLEPGWHTLNVKYRQAGQKIDCLILTDVSGFSPAGRGSLPGEKIIPDNKMLEAKAAAMHMPKIKVNNVRDHADSAYVLGSGDILVPAANLFKGMGIEFEDCGDWAIARCGSDYLKFFMNSNEIVINGEASEAEMSMYKNSDDIVMVSLNAVKKAFGIDYELNEEEGTVNVFYVLEEHYRIARDGEITAKAVDCGLVYEIPCDDPTAKCEVWVKYDINDGTFLSAQNWDSMNLLEDGGINYKLKYTNLYRYWFRVSDPVYRDGAFHGGISCDANEPCSFKVKITKNGETDTFAAKHLVRPDFKKRKAAFTSWADSSPRTNGELLLRTTFENISYYYDCEDTAAIAEVSYRVKGTDEWKKAYEPYRDSLAGQFRGSIVNLRENTTYEVRITVGGETKTAEITTWAENVPIAQEIKLSEIYKPGGSLALAGLHGTDDGWIKIVGDEECNTIDAGSLPCAAVTIADCNNLIFEGITVKGGETHGIAVTDTDKVRIVNCDISEWSLPGELDERLGRVSAAGWLSRNLQAGISYEFCTNFVIDRCYIHDTRLQSNDWDGEQYFGVHPSGSAAIVGGGTQGIVIRYCDLVGSDIHRFNDVMEGKSNGARQYAAMGTDSDIYGNYFIYGRDDAMECDGPQMNVRIYKNRFENTLCGISTAPCALGPAYIFNNQISNLDPGNKYSRQGGAMIKNGNSGDDLNGTQYYFSNTFDTERGYGCVNIGFSGISKPSDYYISVSRNNIFVTRNTGIAFQNKYSDEFSDNDYDLTATFGDTPFVVKEGDGTHNITDMPTYKDYDGGNYRLTEDSAGAKSSVWIDNFAEFEGGKLGAYPDELNYKGLMPYRPADIYTDRALEKMYDGEERECVVHLGDIGEGLTYSIVKNKDFDWLTVTAEDGIENVAAKPNTDVRFKLKGDLSKCMMRYGVDRGRAAVMLRLSNGYSVPITVEVKYGTR
ncbi:MAG: right-handed parallel beta-helix repeat-containing protein [Clostridia bacterium]|nr:right-handed parallel beta-helix repeat-containing protein [Clostridia bacterium]